MATNSQVILPAPMKLNDSKSLEVHTSSISTLITNSSLNNQLRICRRDLINQKERSHHVVFAVVKGDIVVLLSKAWDESLAYIATNQKAVEGASDDENRADASAGSLIGVSHLSSRKYGSNLLRHNASETVQRVTKRKTVGINSRRDQQPTFPKARCNLQSRGQQFRLNEVMSLLDTVLTHLTIGSHGW